MILKALISTTVLLPSFVLAGFYPEDPERFQSKIQKHVAHHVKKNPQVYYFGDDHADDQSKVYKALMKELVKQDPELDCLFIEAPKRFMQEAIDNYWIRNDYSYIEDAVNFVHEVYETESSPVKDTQRKAYMTMAKELGLRTFAIDKLPYPTTVKTLVEMFEEAVAEQDTKKYQFALEYESYNYGVKRNRIMAQRMNEIFNKHGYCKKAISINGFNHLRGKKKLAQLNVWYIPLQLLASDKYDIKFRIVQTK